MSEIKLNPSTASLNYYPEERKSFLKLNDTKYHVYQSRDIFTWIGYILKKHFSFGNWQERSIKIGDQHYKFLVSVKTANTFDTAIKDLAAKALKTPSKDKSQDPTKKQSQDPTVPVHPTPSFSLKPVVITDEDRKNQKPCPMPPFSLNQTTSLCQNEQAQTQPKQTLGNYLKYEAAITKISGANLSSQQIVELMQAASDAKQNNSVALFADHLRTLHNRDAHNDEDILVLYEVFLRDFTGTSIDESITLNGLHVRAMEQHPITLKQAVEKMEELLDNLDNSDDPMQKAKAKIFRNNFNAYKKLNAEALKDEKSLFNVKVSVLKDPFTFEKRFTTPKYLKEEFAPKPGYTFETTGAFFDYQKFNSDANDKDFASADFSNAYLGGGGLTHGAVQEEIQMLEFAEFPILMALFPSPVRKHWCALSTRNRIIFEGFKNRHEAGKGNPDPIKIEGFTRCAHVTGYGKTVFTKPILQVTPPQKNITIVAAAAPKISEDQQFSDAALRDTFNTLVAEMTLLKEQAEDPKNVCFSSGRIGAGVFGNDVEAVYLLHRLAAEHVGIHLKLFAYDPDSPSVKGFEDSWNDLSRFFNERPLLWKVDEIEVKYNRYSLNWCVARIAEYLENKA